MQPDGAGDDFHDDELEPPASPAVTMTIMTTHPTHLKTGTLEIHVSEKRRAPRSEAPPTSCPGISRQTVRRGFVELTGSNKNKKTRPNPGLSVTFAHACGNHHYASSAVIMTIMTTYPLHFQPGLQAHLKRI